MPSCPSCGVEVEYFTRRRNSAFARCPACGGSFKVKDHPELAQYVKVEVPAEQEDVEEDEEVEGQAEAQPVVQTRPQSIQETKPKPRVRPAREPVRLFEEPKPVEEIVTETLLEWGCDENFVKGVVSYIQGKGVFDPGWLFNILLKGRTGRRFTEAEAWMVVDIITSRIQQEKQKAEALGRPYFGGVMVTTWSPTPQQYPYATPMAVQTSYPTYYQSPYQPTSSVPQPTPPIGQLNPQPTYAPQPTSTITPERLQEMIRQALAEQRKAGEMEELKKGIFELEKKLIEQRQQFEKQVSDLRGEVLNVVKETLKETLSSIPQPQPQAQQPQIGPERVELVKAELEKTYIQRLHEIEKSFEQKLAEVRQSYEQRLAEVKGVYEKQLAEMKERLAEAEKKDLLNKIASLEEKIEQYRKEAGKTPISPEGWQSDEARLVAELGHKFLDLVKERKPIEYLVKIVPQLPKAKEAKTEESLEEMIKSLGGEVE